jgi:hypothetical protein
MSEIESLPTEIFAMVFNQLNVKDVIAVAETCWNTNRIFKENFTFIKFDKVQTVSTSTYLKNRELYPPHLLFSLYLHWSHVIDVCVFKDVHSLDLSYCHCVTDVSMLGGVHTLDLSCYGYVTDVSALECVHTLNLSHCEGVTDVSALGGVHTLNLTCCDGVEDVSALWSVHFLNLTGCACVTDMF